MILACPKGSDFVQRVEQTFWDIGQYSNHQKVVDSRFIWLCVVLFCPSESRKCHISSCGKTFCSIQSGTGC